MTQSIFILIAVLLGFFLRGYKTGDITKAKIRKKLTKDKSCTIDWTPPISEEEEASKEVMKNFKQ